MPQLSALSTYVCLVNDSKIFMNDASEKFLLAFSYRKKSKCKFHIKKQNVQIASRHPCLKNKTNKQKKGNNSRLFSSSLRRKKKTSIDKEKKFSFGALKIKSNIKTETITKIMKSSETKLVYQVFEGEERKNARQQP